MMSSFSPSTPLQNPRPRPLSFDPSASPLFSPSAAARYAEQTDQWNQVDKWLTMVFFPNRVPEFERTDETLSYLHTLCTVSTQRTKEKLALQAAQEKATELYTSHATKLENALTGVGLGADSLDKQTTEALDELVNLGMILDVDPLNASVFEIAKGLSDQINQADELELRLHETKSLQNSLESEFARMTSFKTVLETAQRNQDMRQDSVVEKLSEWTRGIKLLEAKTEEYISRTTTLKVQLKSH
jgi:hypothetical protein